MSTLLTSEQPVLPHDGPGFRMFLRRKDSRRDWCKLRFPRTGCKFFRRGRKSNLDAFFSAVNSVVPAQQFGIQPEVTDGLAGSDFEFGRD